MNYKNYLITNKQQHNSVYNLTSEHLYAILTLHWDITLAHS